MITVVVTRYNETNQQLLICLKSLSDQTINVHVLVLDQVTDSHVKQKIFYLNNNNVKFIYLNISRTSLSFARNKGVSIAKTNIVGFCDADCKLQKNWAEEIKKIFKDEKYVAIVGTKVSPKWGSRPLWFNKSKLIQEMYSMIDLSDEVMEVDKVVGASFAVNKNLLKNECYFDEKLGRKNGRLLGGEETDLCERASRKGFKILYTPKTEAIHYVGKVRISYNWIFNRAYWGGFSRAMKGGKISTFNRTKKLITPDLLGMGLIVPFYLTGYIKGILEKKLDFNDR